MELTQVSKKILEKITLLEKARELLNERAKAKALAISEYDKALALKMIELEEPVSIREKVAKGACYEKRYEMELADTMYRNINTKIACIQAELNGLQSVFRHLD